MEEQVIQDAPVAQSEQPVAADTAPVSAPDPSDALRAEYESKLTTLQTQAAEAEERFQGIKAKLDEVYKKQDDQRKKTLEDQGQWKDLWEEANKTAQEKDTRITELERQLDELRVSNEKAATRSRARHQHLPLQLENPWFGLRAPFQTQQCCRNGRQTDAKLRHFPWNGEPLEGR